MEQEALVDLALAAIYAFEAKLTRDEIADAMRAKFAEGATPEEVRAAIVALRDARLAELDGIVLGTN